MVDVRMTMDEYLALLGGITDAPDTMPHAATESMPKKKRSSSYQRRYKANFKKIAPQFKMKSGKWKKNGFRSAVKLAHKMSKK